MPGDARCWPRSTTPPLTSCSPAAEVAAADYRLERLLPPIPDEVLTELIEVTAAINDAPMGALTFEDEVFDLARLQDVETTCAAAATAATGYSPGTARPARSAATPSWPSTRSGRARRSGRHRRGPAAPRPRLGLLLKIDMMRWLAEAEPQLEIIQTWNNVDNRFMINVNEALGYRLSQVFATFERNLDLTR